MSSRQSGDGGDEGPRKFGLGTESWARHLTAEEIRQRLRDGLRGYVSENETGSDAASSSGTAAGSSWAAVISDKLTRVTNPAEAAELSLSISIAASARRITPEEAQILRQQIDLLFIGWGLSTERRDR
jgi:hypothetical protein